jgi:hypothetical protein
MKPIDILADPTFLTACVADVGRCAPAPRVDAVCHVLEITSAF